MGIHGIMLSMRDRPLPSALAGQFRREVRDEGQPRRAWINPAQFPQNSSNPADSRSFPAKLNCLSRLFTVGMLASCWLELP